MPLLEWREKKRLRRVFPDLLGVFLVDGLMGIAARLGRGGIAPLSERLMDGRSDKQEGNTDTKRKRKTPHVELGMYSGGRCERQHLRGGSERTGNSYLAITYSILRMSLEAGVRLTAGTLDRPVP